MAENTEHSLSPQQTFSGYVKHPGKVALTDENIIESLVEKFPYAQMLHAFQAKIYQERDNADHYLSKAALYAPDRSTLYHIIYQPESLVLKKEKAPVAEVGEESTQSSGDPEVAEVASETLSETPQNATEPAVEEIYPETEDGENDFISVDNDVANAASQDSLNNDDFANPDGDVELSGGGPSPAVAQSGGAEHAEEPADETEYQIISNIASADFFRFEEKIDDRLTSQVHNERAAGNVQEKSEANEVSKYDDDTMPYSFRWWLHKTRKDHADTYQPYVNFKLDTTEQIKKETAPVLNQQIIENIFHLQSPLDDIPEKAKPQTVEFTLKRKDDQIIERFIREEPQIRPPRPEKLDTENKARKSSEDSYDMVSETLAQVYIEQMLFNKAIDTYKKLSLKFPEKSAYFADQIRKLETTNKE